MSSLEVNESPSAKSPSGMHISLAFQLTSCPWFPYLQRESEGAHPFVQQAFVAEDEKCEVLDSRHNIMV